MYCPDCGKEIPDTVKICPNCGCNVVSESDAIQRKPVIRTKKKSGVAAAIVIVAIALAALEFVWLFVLEPEKVERSADQTAAGAAESVNLAEITAAPLDSVAVSAPAEVNSGAGIPDTASAGETAGTDSSAGVPSAAAQATVTPQEAASPTAAPTATPAAARNSYVIPDSSTRLITDADLAGLTAEQVRIARNEIYARHGLIFKDPQLVEYFESQSWYRGTVSDAADIDLSEIEYKNVMFINSYEESHG